MKLVLAVALVTALALAGSRFSFLRLSLARLRRPAGIRSLLLSGTEFVFVGLLLGQPAVGVLDAPTLNGLAPILGMGLSWIGLLFGIQWQVRRLDEAVRASLAPALMPAAVAGAVVAVPGYLLLHWRYADGGAWVLVGALTLGAAASDTAHSGLALAGSATRRAARPLARLLRLVADVDGLVAVVGFGLVCCLPVLHAGAGTPLGWAGLSLGLGLALGGVVVALTSYRLTDEELLLILLGTVLCGGGLALHLSLSPLFVNAVAGVVVANLGRERALAPLQSLLVRGDRAVYVLFLLLAGAQWHPSGWEVTGLAVACVGLRGAGKLAGGWLGFRGRLEPVVARRLGLGLLSHGGLALAVVVNLQQVHDGSAPVVDAVTTVVLFGVIASELVSPTLVRRFLDAPEPAR